MQTLSTTCCKSAASTVPLAIADNPFSQMIVLDCYDGAVGGLLKCGICKAEFYFYLLDWDITHIVRIFALAPMPDSSSDEVYRLFNENPDRQVWIPPWPSDEPRSDVYDQRIKMITERAVAPTIAVAWSVTAEKTLSMRGVDSTATQHLSCWFDRHPQPIEFDWFKYLHIDELYGTRVKLSGY